MAVHKMVRFVGSSGEAVYVHPDTVRLIKPSGLPGCSVIHSVCVDIVLGNPDDVYAQLGAAQIKAEEAAVPAEVSHG